LKFLGFLVFEFQTPGNQQKPGIYFPNLLMYKRLPEADLYLRGRDDVPKRNTYVRSLFASTFHARSLISCSPRPTPLPRRALKWFPDAHYGNEDFR
jgi:hypothetical protein